MVPSLAIGDINTLLGASHSFVVVNRMEVFLLSANA